MRLRKVWGWTAVPLAQIDAIAGNAIEAGLRRAVPCWW